MIQRTAVVILLIGIITPTLRAQYYQKREPRSEFDKLSLGLGAGFDYGGIGASVLVYPQNNLGLFVGAGYAIAGMGYNIGAKARLTSNSRLHPYVTAMYGYNTSIAVTNASQYNKIFYGTTFGAGVDFRSRSRSYFTAALLVPVRGADVDDYMNHLKSMGVAFSNSLPALGVSIGYRFVLN